MQDINARERFAERLQRGPLLCDGAMGTELYKRDGMTYGQCLDELSPPSPDLVKSVHLDYIQAGAKLIETNTFGANRERLAVHGIQARTDEINRAGVSLAREAKDLTGQRVWIAGAVGPSGRPLAPVGPLALAQVRRVIKEQVCALAGAGVDLITLETFADLREIGEAVLARFKMRSAGKRAPEVGIKLCQDLLRDVYGTVSGAYFMPLFVRYSTVLEVLEGTEAAQS